MGVITLTRHNLPNGTTVGIADLPLACCALEVLSVKRSLPISEASPDFLILFISGTITHRVSDYVIDQIAEFKKLLPELHHRVIAIGACAISGGPYWDSPTVVPGIQTLGIEIDGYLPGCPPTPSMIMSILSDSMAST